MNQITVKVVEYTAHRLAQELYTFNEPIPDFSTRYPHILEGCLGAPFLAFSGGSPYPSLIDKASILFYLMNKNHPFLNGNKRIAMTTLFVFLITNGKWLKVQHEDLYEFAKLVAGSDARLKDSVVQLIKQFISNHIVDLPKQDSEKTK